MNLPLSKADDDDEPAHRYMVQHPDTSEVADLTLLRILQSSRELVDLNQIAAMCGIRARQAPARWRRATENYLDHHCDQWPPTDIMLRALVEGTSDGQPDALPPHPNVLPPPAFPSDGGRGRARWYLGDIYQWGMRTRRISMLDGKPIVGKARHGVGAARHRPALRTGKTADTTE